MTSQMNDGVWLFLGDKTTAEKVVEKVKSRLTYDFEKDRWSKLVLLAVKEDKAFEVWGIPREGSPRRLKLYPLEGYTGGFGPKLQPTDHRVPEGIYEIVELEPNHEFHRGLILNYPNEFDRSQGASEQSELLGYQFTIHGSRSKDGTVVSGSVNAANDNTFESKGMFDQLLNLSNVEDHSNVNVSRTDNSLGSLSIGQDANIDELFTMVYEIGKENVILIVTPIDFRKQPDRVLDVPGIDWEQELYDQILNEMILQLGSLDR